MDKFWFELASSWMEHLPSFEAACCINYGVLLLLLFAPENEQKRYQ